MENIAPIVTTIIVFSALLILLLSNKDKIANKNATDLTKNLSQNELYRYLIRNKKQTSIDSIAKFVNKPIDTVLSEIQQMIDDKYILNVLIDPQTNSIISSSNPKANTNDFGQQENSDANIICKNCGAVNEIGRKTCEYCGSKV